MKDGDRKQSFTVSHVAVDPVLGAEPCVVLFATCFLL